MFNEQLPNRREEEVLLAFSVEPTYDKKMLEKYLTNYPEHTDALIACSIELMLNETRNIETVRTSEEGIAQAWKRFQFAIDQPAEASSQNPFSSLDPAAFKLLAKTLDLNKLFLTRLRDRAIVAATIPHQFVQKLAAALGKPVDTVLDYLQSPPAMVSAHSFRSTGKPAVTDQISFQKAVETSHLTPAQQETLRDMQD